MEFRNEFTPRVKELVIVTKDTEKREHGINYVPLWKWLLGLIV